MNQEVTKKLTDLVVDYKVLDSKEDKTDKEIAELKAIESNIWNLLLGNI